MGKKDKETKVYFSDRRRYADLWNGGMFQGRQLLKAEQLQEMNPVETESTGTGGVEQSRDLVMKQVEGKQTLAVWVVENQETIDYSMPVKVLLREAMEYRRQLRDVSRENREGYVRFQKRRTRRRKKQLMKGAQENYYQDRGEFLYRFREQDRLVPVVTLVVYWGENWSGPRTLHDMLAFSGEEVLAEELGRLVPEYPLHLLNLSEMENYDSFKTELRTLFELYACRGDKKRFKEYVDTHEACRHLDDETIHMLGVMTKSKALLAVEREEKEEIDMYDVFEELVSDGRKEGRIIGKEEGKAEIVTVVRNMKSHGMGLEETAKLMNHPQEYIGRIMVLIGNFPGEDDMAIAKRLVKEGW